MKELLKEKKQDRYIENFKGEFRVYKKFYRELVYGKSGYCVYERLVDYKTNKTILELGSLTEELIGYKIGITCPTSKTELVKVTMQYKNFTGREYYMDYFDVKKIKENMTPEDFYIKDYDDKICKVLYIKRLKYGKETR